jgi:hypothetical protein
MARPGPAVRTRGMTPYAARHEARRGEVHRRWRPRQSLPTVKACQPKTLVTGSPAGWPSGCWAVGGVIVRVAFQRQISPK